VSTLTTVSHVDVTRDLSVATVLVSVLNESEREGTVDALSRAAGFLRTQLAHRLRLRAVPELRFAYDEALERGNRLDDLISQAVRSDRHED
jgi:ribosome-binding factor A